MNPGDCGNYVQTVRNAIASGTFHGAQAEACRLGHLPDVDGVKQERAPLGQRTNRGLSGDAIPGNLRFTLVRLIVLSIAWLASSAAHADLKLGIEVNPNPVRPNAQLRMALTVTNDGAETVNNVGLRATVPSGVNNFQEHVVSNGGTCDAGSWNYICEVGENVLWNIGSLAPGAGVTVSMVTTTRSDLANAAAISLAASVLVDALVTVTGSETVVGDVDNALTLELDESADPVVAGSQLTYTLTYGNRSGSSIGSTQLVLPLPSGVTVASAGGGTVGGGNVQWSLGTLVAGQTGRKQVVVTVDGAATPGLQLTVDAAQFSGTGADTARAISVARVVDTTALSLAVAMNPDPVRPGERLRTALTVSNHSGADLFNVTLRVRVPAAAENFQEHLLTGNGTCDVGSWNYICERGGELVTWVLGDLAAGEGVTLSMPMQVDTAVGAGQLATLETLLSADGGNQAVLERTAAVDDNNPLTLELDESADPVVAGSQLTYTLTYGNRSGSSIGSTQLVFPLPANATLVSASPGRSISNGQVSWDIGTISAGAGGFRQVKVAVPGGTAPGSQLGIHAAELSGAAGIESARATSAGRVAAAGLRLSVQILAPNQPGNVMNTVLKIKNVTASELQNLKLVARVPAEVNNFNETEAGGGTCDDGSWNYLCEKSGELVRWSLASLAANAESTFTISPTVTAGLANGRMIHVEAIATADGDLLAAVGDTVLIGPSADADLDGLPDSWESVEGLDPNLSNANADNDSDGLTNIEEYFAGSKPTVANSDGDTFIDGSDNCPAHTNQDQSDVDFDRLGDACDLFDNRTSGADTLIGTGRKETLDGLLGADILKGKGGNDTYIVENPNPPDTVIEESGAGIDTVKASVTYTLPANVEKLILTGSDPINGTGNSLGNTLTGNVANNVLDGKAGLDTMSGKAGNDTYIVDNTGDKAIENADQGTDLVKSSVTFTLGDNVENLTLTGTGNRNGMGNARANKIVGNGGANKLDGKGSNDTLTGGAGVDQFLFTTAPNTSTNYDKITDFNVVDDVIVLENAVFTGLTATGPLASSAFVNGTAATTAAHRIIYDKATGTLYYDRDGTGSAAQVRFALLTSATKPTLTAADFTVQ